MGPRSCIQLVRPLQRGNVIITTAWAAPRALEPGSGMLWGTRKVAPAGGPAMCQALCWGATHMSAHLLCSVFLLGRWHPPYPADEMEEAQGEETVLSHSWCVAELGFKPSCVQFQSTCFFFFFFSLRRKINRDFLGLLPSSQMSLSCQRPLGVPRHKQLPSHPRPSLAQWGREGWGYS